MKARSVFLCAVFLLMLSGYGAVARFARLETEAVPIDRVLANLDQQLAKDPNNVETLYHLARIHSMAYSTNLAFVNMVTNSTRMEPLFEHEHSFSDIGVPNQVTHYSDPKAQAAAQRHLTNAISYYERAASLVSKATNASQYRWLVPTIHLGLAWCLDQAGRRTDAISAYRRALQLAWQWEEDPTKYLGLRVSYSDEILGYLLKLLDPVKDAKDIGQLRQDQQLHQDRITLQGTARAITPILIPLQANAPLEELVNPAANVAFDLDGSGIQRHWGWITPKAAWLVYDHDGSGRITSGLQMFGNVTFWIFWHDGYDALSALDDDGDGTLRGPELHGLSLWQDLNGNGICDPGEVRPVTEWGIVAIECRSQLHPTGISFNPQGVVFRDGTTRPSYDWNAPSSAPANVP